MTDILGRRNEEFKATPKEGKQPKIDVEEVGTSKTVLAVIFVTAVLLSFFGAQQFAHADPAPQQSSQPGGQPNDSQRQQMVAKMKQQIVQGIQQRISILQSAVSCVNSASSHEQLKACREQERQSMEAAHKQERSQMESMRPQGGDRERRGPPQQEQPE